jgi:hypothetical protein
VAELCLGSRIFARLVESGLNPAFAVLFLHSQNLPHQGSVARFVLYARIVAWFLAGVARHLFWLAHGLILLQPGNSGSAPSQIHRSCATAAALMARDMAIHRAATATPSAANEDVGRRVAFLRRHLGPGGINGS